MTNQQLQSINADLIKISMTQIDAALKKAGFNATMLLSVHDEIIFEVPSDETDLIQKFIEE